jgi:hypothetical protein
MPEDPQTVATILDVCAQLLEQAEGDADIAFYRGYVSGYLERAAEHLRAADTAQLTIQARALTQHLQELEASKS